MARKSRQRRSRKRVKRRVSRKVKRTGAGPPLGISTARSRKIIERDGKKRVDAFFQVAKKHENNAAKARVDAFWKNAKEHEAVALPTSKEISSATRLQAVARGRETRKSTNRNSLPPLTRFGKKSLTRWSDMA